MPLFRLLCRVRNIGFLGIFNNTLHSFLRIRSVISVEIPSAICVKLFGNLFAMHLTFFWTASENSISILFSAITLWASLEISFEIALKLIHD